MIRAGFFLSFITLLLISLVLLTLHSRHVKQVWTGRELAPSRELVRHLALTDLSLWTEARYTRHPSLADFFAPFQDAPASFEHFPAGSIIAPRLPDVATTLRVHKASIDSRR